MLWNQGKCDYSRTVFINNRGPLTLGTAWDRELDLLTWGLTKVN